MRRRLSLVLAAVAATIAGIAPLPAPTPAEAAPAQGLEAVIGSGSSYAALAIQHWTGYAGARGWDVSYTPSNSIEGMDGYRAGLRDFAGTEAEFSSYGVGNPDRGFQYTPTVAGAIGIMYNVDDQAGNQVTNLQLSRETIALIFTNVITDWSDNRIAADNGGLRLASSPIKVVMRQGQSGTTALFYDFVKHMAPQAFADWERANNYTTVGSDRRLIQVDNGAAVPGTWTSVNGSDQMTQRVRDEPGTISAVEAGYPLEAGVPVAYVQNQAGTFLQPGAWEITVALEGAGLRGDISQGLEAVYANPHPEAYPISAYSYLVTQCAVDGPNCVGAYSRPGKIETLDVWMHHIACDGQYEMGRGVKGYAPLPPHLSQEIANSRHRLTGEPAEQYHQGNCGNPRFDPAYSLPRAPAGPGRPQLDPDDLPPPGESAAGGRGSTATTAAAAGAADAGATAESLADLLTESGTRGVGGGSTDWREAEPVSYDRPGMSPLEIWTWVVVLAALLIPLIGGIAWGFVRRPRF